MLKRPCKLTGAWTDAAPRHFCAVGQKMELAAGNWDVVLTGSSSFGAVWVVRVNLTLFRLHEVRAACSRALPGTAQRKNLVSGGGCVARG